MTGFSLRLLVAGGRRALTAAGLVAAAVAVATLLLSVTLGALHGWDARDARAGWRADVERLGDLTPVADPAALVRVRADMVDGRAMDVVDLTTVAASAPPPGLQRVPGDGEVFVSPALAALLDTLPPDRLADRFPAPPSGLIAETGLRDPDELVAVIGRAQPMQGSVPVAGFTAAPGLTMLDAYRQLTFVAVALVLFPVLGLLGSAARLTAARRAERLATLRLLGASTRQLTVVAVTEVTAVATTAAVVGVLAQWALAPVLATIPLGGSGWYAADLRVSPLVALGVVAGVALLAAWSAASGMRQVVVGPLGVVRRQQARTVHWWRWLGIAAALGAFGVAQNIAEQSSLAVAGLVIGVSVLAMFAVVWLIGPFVVRMLGRRLVRRSTTVPQLLAGRRLLDDPRGAFRPLAGLVLAVFVAGFLAPLSGANGAMATDDTALRARDVTAAQVQAGLDDAGVLATVTGTDRGADLVLPPGQDRDVVRTALAPVTGPGVLTRAESNRGDDVLLADLTRGAAIVLVATFLVAATSAGTAAAARVLDQRRTLRMLRLAGTPLHVLDAARRAEIVRPMLLCAGIALLVGLACAAPFATASKALAPAGLVVLGSVLVAGVLAVVAASAASRPLLQSVTQERGSV